MRTLFLLFTAGVLGFGWVEGRAAAEVPNVLFILTDDLGINDLGCYGRTEHRTPNLDRLAGEGMRFTSAYCAQPICSPSRAALLTGKAPARLHLTTYLPGRADARSQKLLHPKMRQQLPVEEVTVAEMLMVSSRAPYVKGWIGKWHLGGKGFLPTDQGFDYYYPGTANTEPSESEGGKGEFDLTRAAEEFLEKNREKPFVLFVSHNTPHINFTAQRELIEKNKGAFEPVYAALIESMDRAVGQLLTKIDQLGLREKTVVVFTSDNGGLHVPEGRHQRVTHNKPYRAGKGFVYEGGLRIPLIVRWPGKVAAGSVVETPVINTDWTPTLLEIFEMGGRNERFDGRSMVPVLLGKSSGARKFFWHFPHYTNQGSSPAGAMREGEWKLVEHYEDGRLELFNLREDIGERNNVAAKEPERVRAMRAELDEWRKRVNAQTNSPNPEFDAGMHRAIYKDFDASLYEPAAADAEEFGRVIAWRKLMDQATKKNAGR